MSTTGNWRGPNIVKDGLVLYIDPSSPNSYYPKDNTIIKDISGYGNNGTLVNGPTYDSANGGNIVFDGTNDYTILPINFFPFPSITTFTISLWFKSSQANGGTIFGQQNSTNLVTTSGYVPVIYLRQDGLIRIEPFWTDSTSNFILSTNTLNNNTWYNIVTTYNNGTNILYINSIFNSQRTGLNLVSYSTDYYYFIGAGVSSVRGLGSNFFNGNISNFLFYNRVLSSTEIQQNFDATKSRFGL